MIRKFATPMVIGGIVLSGTTGILMYFHADRNFNKTAHETFGWALLTGVVLHISTNWAAFKLYFSPKRPVSLIVIGLFLFVLTSSFFFKPPPEQKQSPTRMALNALTKSPLSIVAQVVHKEPSQLVNALNSAGFSVKGPDESIDSISKGSRQDQNKVLDVVFSP